MARGSRPLLEVRALYKHFGGVVATDHLDLAVAEGRVHALIGPNGAGKTTLVAQICGEVEPDAGQVVFDGADVSGLSAHERVAAGLARSFQITRIFGNLPVRDNIALAVQARSGTSMRFWDPVASEAALGDEIDGLLAEFGLTALAPQRAASLPHADQRRLEVALALACRPRLLLLDEPLAGMGAEDAQTMIALIARLKEQVTILLVEHDMDAVFRLADVVSVLVAGRVIATGAPQAMRDDPEVRRAYLGEEEVVS
jgi:branched-chain amino acid transport system ATP-binding protein